MKTPICPSCGCSLVRLGVELATAKRYEYGRTSYSFCSSAWPGWIRDRLYCGAMFMILARLHD